MAATRDKVTREQHMAFIADWIHERGLKYGDKQRIADELEVDISTISRDVKRLMASYRNSIEVKGQSAFEREVNELNWIIEEARAEYKRSKEPMKSQTLYQGDEKQFVQTTKKERVGDARYLAVMLDAMDKRTKLLGLSAPIAMTMKHEGSIDLVSKSAEDMTDDELAHVIASGSGTGIITPPNGKNIQH